MQNKKPKLCGAELQSCPSNVLNFGCLYMIDDECKDVKYYGRGDFYIMYMYSLKHDVRVTSSTESDDGSI